MKDRLAPSNEMLYIIHVMAVVSTSRLDGLAAMMLPIHLFTLTSHSRSDLTL